MSSLCPIPCPLNPKRLWNPQYRQKQGMRGSSTAGSAVGFGVRALIPFKGASSDDRSARELVKAPSPGTLILQPLQTRPYPMRPGKGLNRRASEGGK